MHDAPPPGRAEPAGGGDPPAGPLSPERVEAVLADFRRWLGEFRGGEPRGSSEPEPVDLFTLVAQFTALRHEVNLQTRAARAAVEQTAEAVRRLDQPADPTEALRPLVRALVEIADALSAAERQVNRTREAAEQLLADLNRPAPPRRGVLGRLFGPASDVASAPPIAQANADRLRPLLAGVADGYALSLRRVARALSQVGLEAIEAEGRPFDPELMEAVELADAPGRASGTVVEVVRPGYRWNGKPFRFAQVKVAR